MTAKPTRPVARRAQGMPRSAIREVMELAAKIPDAIHLEVGEPDFATPAEIIEQTFRDAADGWTKYAPNAGVPALRQAVADRTTARIGSEVGSDRILVTTGAVGGLYTAIMTICDDGDEILVPDPGWPNYFSIAHLAGCKAVTYPHDPARGFVPDPAEVESLITDRTKLIMINSPNNPTGAVFSRETIDGLLDVANRHGLFILSDEIYEDFIFSGTHESALGAGADDRVFVVSGVSKSYAMTGWRVGWLVCPNAELAATGARLQEPVTSCASSISQRAALAALACPDQVVGGIRAVFDRRRRIVLEALDGTGLLPMEPRGAFYALLDIGSTGMDSLTFAKTLLTEKAVATVPGITFGPDTDRWIRIAFTTADDQLRQGMERIKSFVAERS